MNDKIDKAIDRTLIENGDTADRYRRGMEYWREHLTGSNESEREANLRQLTDLVFLKLDDEDFEDTSVYKIRHKIQERLKTTIMGDSLDELHAIKASGGSYRGGIYFVRAGSKKEAEEKENYEDDEYIAPLPEFGKMILRGDLNARFIFEE